MPRDFTPPAPRQEGQGEAPGVQAPCLQQQVSPREIRQGFHERVPHEGHRHPLLPVKFRLEGENHHQAVHQAGDGAHPVAAPGPHLGADVVHHRHLMPPGQPGRQEIEIREIDENGEGQAVILKDTVHRLQGMDHGRQAFGHLGQAHHRQVFGPGHQPHTLCRQGLPADAHKYRPRQALPQGRHQPGAVGVPGGLPRDDEDVGTPSTLPFTPM